METMKRREASHGSAGCGADTEKVPGPELKQLELGSVGSFVRNHRKKIFLIFLCLCTLLAVQPSSRWFGAELREDRTSKLQAELKGKTAEQILQWAAETVPGLVQFSSFGPSGMVILDLLDRLGLLEETRIVTIDTLHLFPESYEHLQNVTRRYPKMKLQTFYPKEMHGMTLWKDDFQKTSGKLSLKFSEMPAEYSYLTKVEPTLRALQQLAPGGWITGRRRSQGELRSHLPVVENDAGRLKINPLAYWTWEDVWQYLHTHEVPYNVLHDRGYSSVGDVMNTRPTKPGEGERAGRFELSQETECGMHTHLARIAKKRAESASKRAELDDAPHLPCDTCVEVNKQNFEEVVLKTKQDMLLEFYSPMCGHCTHFAPTYATIAHELSISGDALPARMDLYHNQVPQSAKDAGFEIHAFPTLILVRPMQKKLKLVTYHRWRRDVKTVLDWVKEELTKPLT
ncbi:unnamed protein product [Durusdinium trenchii]|uniref:Thioredoxin domain-containing protein n=1 Tax=Durusdinium trenchii TaxID=1381693 RepID=A0ABP0R3G9_9DINO